MLRKASRIVVFLIAVFVLAGTQTTTGWADPINQPEGVEAFCQTWSNNPYRSGTVVKGTGGVSCSSTVAQIKVVVQIRDSSGRVTQPAVTVTCSNQSNCSATATLSYTGGLNYETLTSGYVGTWNGYYQSDSIYIP